MQQILHKMLICGSPWTAGGPSWDDLGAVLGPDGAFWGVYMLSGDVLDAAWGRLDAILGRFWDGLGSSGAVLGRLGAVLNRLGAVFGPSWAVFGRPGSVWGRLGAVLEPS